MTTFPNSFDRHISAAKTSAKSSTAIRQMPGLVKILFCADLLLGLLYLLSWNLFHYWLPATWRAGSSSVEWKFKWLSSVFDLDAEMNVPTWFSSMQLMLIGLLLAVFAWAKFDRTKLKASIGLIAVSALFILFSMDEVATIHENVGGKLVYYLKAQNQDSVFVLFAFWTVLLVPTLVILACIVSATRVHWAGRPLIGLRFVFGMVVFLGSAVGVELVWAAVFHMNPSESPIEVFIEEVGEMVGATLLVWTSLDLLASARVRFTFGESIQSQS